MTPDATRRRAIGKSCCLSAGFLVLVADQRQLGLPGQQGARRQRLVVHTVEVENQMSILLLEIRRAESATRGYLADIARRSSWPSMRPRPPTSCPTLMQLRQLISDNPVQVENFDELRTAIEAAARANSRATSNCVKQQRRRQPASRCCAKAPRRDAVQRIRDIGAPMRAEEDRLFAMRTDDCRPHADARLLRDGRRLRPGDRAGRHLDFPGAALVARARRRRGTAARQQPQSRGHGRRAHRRSARSQ